MVKSQTRFGKPSWAIDAPAGEPGETEQAVDFQFTVAWTSLFGPQSASKFLDAVVPVNRVPILVKEQLPPREETALTRAAVEEPSAIDRPKMEAASTISWEMVVPKMVRPAAKPTPEIAAAPEAALEPDKKDVRRTRLMIAAAITLVGILILLLVHHWVAAPKPAPAAPSQGSVLKFETAPQGNGRIDIRWNPKAAPVMQAREARVLVMERDQQPHVIALDAEQLKTGHLSYQAATERVVLRMDLSDRSGASTQESTLALLPELTPPPPPSPSSPASNAQTPAKPDAIGPIVKTPAAKAPVDPSRVVGDPGEQAAKPIVRAFTPPRPGQAKAVDSRSILLDPPSAVTTGSGATPMRLPESANRIAPPPTKQAAPVRPIPVGGNLQAGKLIKKVSPVYPPMASVAHIQGIVRLMAVVGKDGKIKDLKPVSGASLLVKAATDAVKQWEYQPAVLNGEPVEVQTQIDINFNLSDK